MRQNGFGGQGGPQNWFIKSRYKRWKIVSGFKPGYDFFLKTTGCQSLRFPFWLRF
jgi:hypothetical protein